MTRESIKLYVDSLKYKRYSSGVMHIATPEWLEDIRYLITCVEFLLNEK